MTCNRTVTCDFWSFKGSRFIINIFSQMCSFHGHGGEIHVHKRHQTPENKSSLEFPARTFLQQEAWSTNGRTVLCHSCVIVCFNPLIILTLFVSHPRETCQTTLLKMARSRKGKVTTKYPMMAGIYYFNISIVRSIWIHPVTPWNALVVQRADAGWMNKPTLLSTGAGLQGVCAVKFEHFKRPNKTETQNSLKLYKICTTWPHIAGQYYSVQFQRMVCLSAG